MEFLKRSWSQIRLQLSQLTPTQLWAIMHTFLDQDWVRHEEEVEWPVMLTTGYKNDEYILMGHSLGGYISA